MKQQTLAMAADQGVGFETRRKRTRRDEFLDTMNRIMPWAALCAVLEPYYPRRGNGRPPIGLERMLRIHFIQHWFNLADLACEEALYDSTRRARHSGGRKSAKFSLMRVCPQKKMMDTCCTSSLREAMCARNSAYN